MHFSFQLLSSLLIHFPQHCVIKALVTLQKLCCKFLMTLALHPRRRYLLLNGNLLLASMLLNQVSHRQLTILLDLNRWIVNV